MWVWRDKSGRIASVTGSIHQETLDWLRAEDEWKSRKSQSAPQPTPDPAEPAPAHRGRGRPRKDVEPVKAVDESGVSDDDDNA
ncbi:hypothetical protein MTY414_59610 [Mycolicibacterium mageritense]|nr:hypothetical protein MTY414_59610 [Mycolicibacterium mageritense]